MAKLTRKQQKFIDAYLSNGLNATRAAISVGYSERSARSIASENLAKPDIKAEIDRRLNEQAMGEQEVLARLASHARGDMREFIGLTFSDLKWHPAGALIREMDRSITRHPDGSLEESFKIKLYDSQAALQTLWKINQIASGKATENVDILDAKERLAQLIARQSGRKEPDGDSGGTE